MKLTFFAMVQNKTNKQQEPINSAATSYMTKNNYHGVTTTCRYTAIIFVHLDISFCVV